VVWVAVVDRFPAGADETMVGAAEVTADVEDAELTVVDAVVEADPEDVELAAVDDAVSTEPPVIAKGKEYWKTLVFLVQVIWIPYVATDPSFLSTAQAYVPALFTTLSILLCQDPAHRRNLVVPHRHTCDNAKILKSRGGSASQKRD
jgi:hypothetical protein